LRSNHHSKHSRTIRNRERLFKALSRVLIVVSVTFGAMAGAQLLRTTTAGASPPEAGNTVTFTSSPPTLSSGSSQVLGVVGTSYVPAATARSGDTVILTIDAASSAGACSFSGGTVSFEAPGACVIDANDPGNGSYLAAPQEEQSIDVNYAPTCATLAYQEPGAPNGNYSLDVQGVSTAIYCANMSSSPSEYLDLPAGTSTNFSQLGSNWGGGSTGAISTTYTRVRFYPSTLQIENADTQFASSTGSNGENGAHAVAWGIAAACSGTNASFEVNLEGTAFDFAFGINGFGAAGSSYDGAPIVADDSTNQAFGATNVNGFCGHAGFHSPNPGGPGYSGVWGTPSNGTGSFMVDVSQINSSNQVIVGQPLSFVQTAATPLAQGTVQTTVNGVASGATASYTSSGACSVDQSGLITLEEVGTCTVVVSSTASGDAIASNPVAESFQVLGAQSIDITSSDSSPVVGSTYALTSTGGASGNPVTYGIDSQSTGGCQLAVSGTVVDLETPGTCIIDANQQGDADYVAASQQQQTVTITEAETSTAIATESVVTGQPTTLTATIGITSPGSDAFNAPTGTVAFLYSQTGVPRFVVVGCSAQNVSWPVTPDPNNTGTATCETSFPAAGADVDGHVHVRAVYSGDANFLASFSPTEDESVSPASISTSTISTINPSVSGEPTDFDATLSIVSPGSEANGNPSGTAEFRSSADGTNWTDIPGCSAQPMSWDAVASSGSSSCSEQTFAASSSGLEVEAVYSGDLDFIGSPSVPSVVQTVYPAETAGSLNTELNSTVSGESLTMSDTVTVVAPGEDSPNAPTGTVEFQQSTDNGGQWSTISGCSSVALTWAASVHDGTASCVTAFDSAAGNTYLVRAVYGGDTSFSGSDSPPATISVSPDVTSTTVSSNASPSAPGVSVQFTAGVTAAGPGGGIPTGSVTFTDGSSVLCSGVTLSDGSATCSAHLPVQPTSQTVTATYSGSASMLGSTGSTVQSVMHGYWMVGSDGSVQTYGQVTGYGSMAGIKLNKPMVGISATPDAKGYRLAAADGGVFTFGDAAFYGSAAHYNLGRPIVGIVSTSDGAGYYLVGSDGGVFAFGDAVFHGSASGSVPAGTPVVGLAPSKDLGGYWLILSTGRILTFGDAPAYGSVPSIYGRSVAVTATADEAGYWIISSEGSIHSFGDATSDGSATRLSAGVTIVGMADS
jgi:hypothetical protein